MPLFTAHSVVQGLASDSALLLSLVMTVERAASAEQKAAFVRHFVSLLLLCRDEGVFAGSELLGELLLLDLDEAMWKQHNPTLFMRRSNTIVSALLDQLARETFAAPEGNLLPHLVAATRLLSASEDATNSSVPTPMGVSLGGWSRHSEDSVSHAHPSAAGGGGGGVVDTCVYDRFSTSELAGLATAEQQFAGDGVHTPRFGPSLASSAGRTGMEGSRPPLHQGQVHHNPPSQLRTPSSSGLGPFHPGHSTTWHDSFRLTRDADAVDGAAAAAAMHEGGTPARVATALQVRDAVDFFAEAAEVAAELQTSGAPLPEASLGVVDVRAEAVLSLALQVQDVVARHISDCPLVLRRAFWVWLRASSGRSGPPESGEVSPVMDSTTSAAGGTSATAGALQQPQPPQHHAEVSPQPLMASFEFLGMATMVVLHMLTPLLQSIPSFVLPVEEDEGSEAYVRTAARFQFLSQLLLRAAYGLQYDERREPGMAPLNRGMRELHRRWVGCFSALADYRTGSSMNWCCPLPTPLSGLTVCSREEEQLVLHRYFQLLDGFLVPYLQTTILLRRFTEPIHLPRWLRCTYYAERHVRGWIGGVANRPPLLSYTPHVTPADLSTALATDVGESEASKLHRMGLALSRVMDALTPRDRHADADLAAPGVSAFMANFISFLGTNGDGVTTLLLTEDLLRWFWVREAPQYVAVQQDAAAVVTFFIYLAVQHNIASPSFQLVLIPRVTCVLRPTEPDGPEHQFTTADTLAWLRGVLEDLPHDYRQHCKAVWTSTIVSGDAVALSADVLRSAHAADMPPLRVCDSLSALLATVMHRLPSYVPLNADDYHWMVCEHQQQQHQEQDQLRQQRQLGGEVPQRCHAIGATPVPSGAGDSGEKQSAAAPEAIVRKVVLGRATSNTLRSLRMRWRRPLTASESLRVSGILPLHSTRGLFEMLCTITCRRLWTDASLQPIVGVSDRSLLTVPLCAVLQVYESAADVAATLLVAVDATPPPRWLRELQFNNGCVTVRASEPPSSPHSASPPPVNSPTAALAEEVRWPRCTWFESAAGVAAAPPPAALTTQWESLMQHVLFFSSEFDATVTDDDGDANVSEQILSTRWGLSTTASAEDDGALTAVPSLRHISVESLWRLFVFNVRQTCHIMRRVTPRECPFCRMEAAIVDVLRGNGSAARAVNAVVRPGTEEAHLTLTDRLVQAAADALRTCSPSEVTLVRLIVSVAAYIHNVFTVVSQAPNRPPSFAATTAEYRRVARSGTAQLVYGKAMLSAAQERLVEVLCFEGEKLVEKAFLPYFDNCTWHPYGRLLYQC